ncbi:MAG: ATP-binding cassette domain-containing protein [Pseudomonadota bacterium]
MTETGHDQSPSSGLWLDGVDVKLGDATLVSADAHVAPGEILTVMGPSGSGKTSLLGYVAGILAPEFTATGAVWLDGARIDGLAPEKRRVGLLFQDPLLFPHLSVGGNLAFGLSSAIKGRAARHAAVEAALEDAGLAGFASRDPATLSGGQKARVALLRVLLSDPRALLLDEAFSKLDTQLRQQFRAYVFDQARARGLPVLMVTHDPQDAEAAGGRVIEVRNGHALD